MNADRRRQRPQARPRAATGRARAAGTGRRTGSSRPRRRSPGSSIASAALKARDPEQAQVDHRVGQRQLAAHEQRRRRPARRRSTATGSEPTPSWAICLRPKITASTATSDSAALTQVEPAGVGVAVLGQHDRPEHEQQRHHRHAEQEHRAPPEVLEQEPAEHRTDRAAGRERRDPDADRDRALRGSWNMLKISDSVDGASVAPAMPEQRAADDQHLGAGRERREDRQRRRTRPRRSAAAGGGRSGRRACPS